MKERVVTTVRIRHHRIEGRPRFARLQVSANSDEVTGLIPIDAARGLIYALTISGMLWTAVIMKISL